MDDAEIELVFPYFNFKLWRALIEGMDSIQTEMVRLGFDPDENN